MQGDSSRRHPDIIGLKFGYLTVISQSDIQDNKCGTLWDCKCECGNITKAITAALRRGHKKSCGCNLRLNPNQRVLRGKLHKSWNGYEGISGSFWCRVKASAIKRKITFDITMEYAWDLYIKQDRKCAISNVDLCMATSSYELNNGLSTASLDRIDSTKGYIVGNVQWVHVEVNYMKQWYSQEKFLHWCATINKYQSEKLMSVS